MKYGMTFLVDLYEFEAERDIHVITTPGDFIRMSNWADGFPEVAQAREDVRNLRYNFATVWFAFKRRGELDEFGLPHELTMDAVDEMADRFSIYVNDVEDGSLPLAEERER